MQQHSNDAVIVAIIGTHHRTRYVTEIQRAVSSQTVPPARIVVVNSGSNDVPLLYPHCNQIKLSWNAGVWFRFHVCWQFPEATHFCIFDDDTIPGEAWFENCLETLAATRGVIVGAAGVTFKRGTRDPREYCGTVARLPTITPVDIVGHSWFFGRDLLEFAYDDFLRLAHRSRVPMQMFPMAGEDYWFSVAARQKWLVDTNGGRGVPDTLWGGVYVPPHRASDMSSWGSLRPELGTDPTALYLHHESERWKEVVHERMRELGWTTLYAHQNQRAPQHIVSA